MKASLRDVAAQRALWQHCRAEQHLTSDAHDGFARGGLGRHTDDLDLRILMLPSDPESDAARLDADTLEWLKQDRQSPYGGYYPSWGNRNRGVNDAVVVFDLYRDNAGWARYLALHRHGGVEVGVSGMTFSFGNNVRAFFLRPIVGIAWITLAIQAEAIERWDLQGPFELTLALPNTKDATLAGFAEGWREPNYGFGDHKRCLDDHVLIRREIHNAIDPEAIALDLGERIELAFGTTLRRHIAQRGEFEGRFDPRFQVF